MPNVATNAPPAAAADDVLRKVRRSSALGEVALVQLGFLF
jgi:hypothetical protein